MKGNAVAEVLILFHLYRVINSKTVEVNVDFCEFSVRLSFLKS